MTPVYDLRSDTVTRPTPAMKRAMMEAPLGDDVLGDDPTVKRLEAAIAERTGKAAGIFCPSGTQANQIAIHLHARPGTEVLVERRAHVFDYEAGAPAALTGVQLHPVETPDGVLLPERLEPLVRPTDDPHHAVTRLVWFENTHNSHGGRVIPIEPMEETSAWARGRGLAVHLDGARLFNAAVAGGVDVARYAACADTVSLCLSKGLGAPVGTCLVGDGEAIERARWIRKRWGGAMRQAGILAAAGLHALERHVDRLAEDHALAAEIAAGLAEIEGLEVDPGRVETNMVLVDVPPPVSVPTLLAALEEEGVWTLTAGARTIRLVTHLDVPPDAGREVPPRFRRAWERTAGEVAAS